MSKYLIMNADDFGLTNGVNRGIMEAFAREIVTSTTLMVNMPGFANAVELAKENEGLPVGIHLNLTYGRPVLPIDKVSSLTNHMGLFEKDPGFVLKQGRKKEVKLEYWAQIHKFLDTGLPLSHIDTHHHLHGTEWVLDIILEIAGKLGVPIRCLNKNAFAKRGVKRVAKFKESAWLKGGPGKLIEFLYLLPDGSTETLCHPGYADDELASLSIYNVERARELEILLNPMIPLFIKKCGIIMTNYPELLKRGVKL